MIYLAAPYSHPDARIKQRRYDLTLLAAVRLANRTGELVYAPTVYGHPLHVHPEAKVGGNWQAWAALDTVMVNACSRFCVLALEGWDDSQGIVNETELAQARGLTIEVLLPADLGLPNA